jgi:tetratricopeptide (TPR) repeat protein
LAIEQLRKTIEMEPAFAQAHWELGIVYVRKGAFADATFEFQKATAFSPKVTEYKGGLGYAYAREDRKAQARELLAELKELSKRRYVSGCDLASIYAGLGEKDQAFAWLERAYEDHDFILTTLRVHPLFDSLRSDPRSADLLRRMGLPQ